MKILVTGADGFVGKNLIAQLANENFKDVVKFTHQNSASDLVKLTADVDFVFHLAGVNRPKTNDEFYKGNADLTQSLVAALEHNKNYVPIVLSSSIQARLNNDYGLSKKAAETVVFKYGEDHDTPVFVYQLKNLFGKWSRPNYNSAISTFAYNLAHDLPIKVNDSNAALELNYIDDVVAEFIYALKNNTAHREGKYSIVPITYSTTVGEIANKLTAFNNNRQSLIMPSLKNKLDRDLYGTYLSYLDEDNFSYNLKKNEDNRGWLAEFIKSEDNGQIFISTTKPGITRGNHWHNTKVEKFLVIQGQGLLQFRKIGTDKVIEYKVSGDTPEPVDIPVGYIHNIKNIGDDTMITLFWACEIFDSENPDTYYEEV